MDIKICPICGSPMKLRNSARGQFWGCTKYPACKGTINSDEDMNPNGTQRVGKQEAIQKMHEEKVDGIQKSVSANNACNLVGELIRANLHSGDLAEIEKSISRLSEYILNNLL